MKTRTSVKPTAANQPRNSHEPEPDSEVIAIAEKFADKLDPDGRLTIPFKLSLFPFELILLIQLARKEKCSLDDVVNAYTFNDRNLPINEWAERRLELGDEPVKVGIKS